MAVSMLGEGLKFTAGGYLLSDISKAASRGLSVR